jgi:hypothetical protein
MTDDNSFLAKAWLGSVRVLVTRVLISAASIVVFFTLAELFLRLFIPQQEAMRWFQSNPAYGYVLKSRFHQRYHYIDGFTMDVRTNEWGHRGKSYAKADLENPAVIKILLIGDSFTFGQGVNDEDTFGALLEHDLNRAGKKYSVINAGVGGWGTLQSVAYARDHLSVFHPSIVVYTFCGNDPSDDARFMKGVADNDLGALRFPGKIFLRNYSHVYRLLYFSLAKLRHRLEVSAGAEGTKSMTHDLQSESAISEEEWKRSLEALERLGARLGSQNPKNLLMVQASAPWELEIQEHLAPLAKNDHIVYVDLYDMSKALPDTERQLPYDGHWSRKMHAISAMKLADAIRRAAEM